MVQVDDGHPQRTLGGHAADRLGELLGVGAALLVAFVGRVGISQAGLLHATWSAGLEFCLLGTSYSLVVIATLRFAPDAPRTFVVPACVLTTMSYLVIAETHARELTRETFMMLAGAVLYVSYLAVRRGGLAAPIRKRMGDLWIAARQNLVDRRAGETGEPRSSLRRIDLPAALAISAAIVLLLGTMAGPSVGGQHLTLAGLPFQTGDVVRILIVVAVARLLPRFGFRARLLSSMSSFRPGLVRALAPVVVAPVVCVPILFVNRDLGPLLLVVVTVATMIGVAVRRARWVLLAIGLVVLAGYLVVAIPGLSNTGRDRVRGWLAPEPYQVPAEPGRSIAELCAEYTEPPTRFPADLPRYDCYGPGSAGEHLRDAQLTISRGRWFGVGPGNTWAAAGALPFAYSDSAIATVAEQWGFIGVVVAMSAVAIIVFGGLGVSARCIGSASLVPLGFSLLLGYQTVLIAGGLARLLPLTGITFPLLSEGNASRLATMLMLAVLVDLGAAEVRHG